MNIFEDGFFKTHIHSRSPLIAEAFHRTGAVEIWGRGTTRVIAQCRSHGIAPPTFEERQGFLIVTSRATITALAKISTEPESRPESKPASLEHRVLISLRQDSLGKAEISFRFGQMEFSGQLNKVIRGLVHQGLIEYTIVDKPNCRLQKYRLTKMGRQVLKERTGCI